jgi:hypothetical protein
MIPYNSLKVGKARGQGGQRKVFTSARSRKGQGSLHGQRQKAGAGYLNLYEFLLTTTLGGGGLVFRISLVGLVVRWFSNSSEQREDRIILRDCVSVAIP